MSERSKIDIQVGSITFSAEGDQEWLSAQLEKVLSAAATTAGDLQSSVPRPTSPRLEVGGEAFTTSLSAHLKHMKADKNQVLRFLATADWLRCRGASDLSSGAVAKALSSNQQSRLANPAECLNRNVGKGFCEKTGKSFFITPEGLSSLGYQQ